MEKYEDLIARAEKIEKSLRPHNGKETRHLVAEKLGMAESRYGRIKAVVRIAQNTKLPLEDQIVAREALADMNATHNVYGNWLKVRHLSERGKKKAPPVDIRSNKASINRAIESMNGIVFGLNRITLVHSRLTSVQIDEWVEGLANIRRELEKTINTMRAYKTKEIEK